MTAPEGAGRFSIDGRVPVCAVFLVVVQTATLAPDAWRPLAAQALLVSACLFAARVPARWLLLRSLLLAPLVTSLAVSRALDGAAGGWQQQGFILGRIAVSFAALGAAGWLVQPHEWVAALGRLRLPMLFVTVIALILRYIEVLGDEGRRMLRAQRSRGTPRGVAANARLAGQMVGTLLVRSIERSERLARAMEARGFGGEFPRPTPQALRKRECGILVAVLLLQVAIGGLR